jgi:hypothetical protein
MGNPLFRQALGAYFAEKELSVIWSITAGAAGLGGLRSNCGMNVVLSGFERLVLAGFDRVEPSNLIARRRALAEASAGSYAPCVALAGAKEADVVLDWMAGARVA